MPGMQSHGAVGPEEAQRQIAQERKEKIESVKRYKNKKARQAAQRATVVLVDLGLTRAERRAIGKRAKTEKIQKPQNYRWQPTAPVESLETEP